MARHRQREPAQIEPPSWYRTFEPGAWDAPDAHELAMQAGHLGMPWPDELHRMHAERRWAHAKHAYRREHPALAEQEFAEIVASERRAREGERRT